MFFLTGAIRTAAVSTSARAVLLGRVAPVAVAQQGKLSPFPHRLDLVRSAQICSFCRRIRRLLAYSQMLAEALWLAAEALSTADPGKSSGGTSITNSKRQKLGQRTNISSRISPAHSCLPVPKMTECLIALAWLASDSVNGCSLRFLPDAKSKSGSLSFDLASPVPPLASDAW